MDGNRPDRDKAGDLRAGRAATPTDPKPGATDDVPPTEPAAETAPNPGEAPTVTANKPTRTWPPKSVDDTIRSPATPLRVFYDGEVVADRFRIVRFINRGGMGEVYEAEDQELRENVALKTIRPEIAERAQVIESFTREVRRARRIIHHNFCRVYDMFSVAKNGRTIRFLTMELLHGETLHQLLQREQRLLPERALPILDQMAAGLTAIHQADLIHCDFKPSNVFLVAVEGGTTRVVVMDLGLADRKPKEETVSRSGPPPGGGTPDYMSPEQWASLPLAQASDVYSFGLVAYEMVTGTRPWPREQAVRRLTEDPPPAKTRCPDLPSHWNDGLAAATRRDLLRRTPSVAAVVASFRRRPGPRWWWAAAAVVALAIVLVLVPGGPLWRRVADWIWPPPPGANQQFPAWSKDEKLLAYSVRRGGRWDIYVRELASGVARNLTGDNPGDDTEPAFSPDGRYLAFHSTRRPPGTEEPVPGLYRMELRSGKVELLARDGHHPAWSPDGTEIAFADEGIESPDDRTLTTSRLWAVHVASRRIRLVYAGDAVQPAWSPDGSQIAFMGSTQGNRDIFTIPVSGGEPRRITQEPSVEWSPAWSADGRHLFFCSDRDRTMKLWHLTIENLTGGPIGLPEVVPLTGDYVGPIHVSASGRIAYVRDQSRTNFYRIPFDAASGKAGPAEALRISSNWQLAAEQSLSPNARQLVFATLRIQRDLFVGDVASARLTRLTDDMDQDRSPVWSPDGEWIAFQSNRHGSYQIFVVKPDGSRLKQLTESAGDSVNPVWHPGSRELIFTVNQVGVFRMPFRTDRMAEVSRVIEFGGPEKESFIPKAWSPDGARLVGVRISRGGRPAGISTLDLPSARWEPVTSDGGLSPAFLPDGRRVVYTRDQRLWLLDLTTGVVTLVPTPAGAEVQRNVAVSPDGQWILLNHIDQRTSVEIFEPRGGESRSRR